MGDRLSERMRSYEALECFGVRFVLVSHINVEISTGKHMFPRNHYGFNIVTNIMHRLDREVGGRYKQPRVLCMAGAKTQPYSAQTHQHMHTCSTYVRTYA